MIGAALKLVGPSLVSAGAFRALSGALNHLLAQHPNAAARLAAHAGKKVRMGIDGDSVAGLGRPPELWLGITDVGRLEPTKAGSADVEMLLKPSLAAGRSFASEGVKGLTAHLRIEGDVLLAGLLGELIHELRWDYEDDLSRVVGDRAAQRIGDAVRTGRQKFQAFGNRGRDQAESVVSESASRDGSPVVGRAVFDRAREQIDRLGERLARLEERARRRGS